jgi:putative colanic acid biosynthesis acetyltransferase WcaF
MNNTVDLSQYDNHWFNPGGNKLKRTIWFYINIFIFNSYLFPFSFLKRQILRLFGAKIASNVLIKPKVNIKYPWNLEIGKNTWIGESVWIDNLCQVSIGENVCISQGAMILCGNHNFKSVKFNLIVESITIEDGAWIGAKSLVCPGVTAKSHSILTAMSVATKDLAEYGIYQGNPAEEKKKRNIS